MEKNIGQQKLIELAQAGNFEARSFMFENNVGLVRSCVKRFLGRGYETEDLFQVGSIGLVKAIERFDLTLGLQFSTYAVPMIMGEIRRYIRDDGIIKVSRSIKELSSRAAMAREALVREMGEEPKISEIAAKIGEPAEEVAAAFEATAKPESLYAKPLDGQKDGQALIDKIQSEKSCEDEVVNRVLISSALKTLNEREQKIIILRYFRRKTQTQIANMLGISQVQVSRIEKKVLSGLKEKIEEK